MGFLLRWNWCRGGSVTTCSCQLQLQYLAQCLGFQTECRTLALEKMLFFQEMQRQVTEDKTLLVTQMSNIGSDLAIDTIFDPAHSKYWRMFNELESKQAMGKLKKSLKRTLRYTSPEKIDQSVTDINYA